MSGAVMHPPANRRCQVYIPKDADGRSLDRCVNEGTHWELWPGCVCPDPDEDVCMDDFYTWECGGPHRLPEQEAA